MENEHRKALRVEREQLLTLLNGWDPVGRIATGAPRTDYDCIVDKLFGLLASHATKEQVAQFLETEIRERFGAAAHDIPQFVNRASAWFAMTEGEQSPS